MAVITQTNSVKGAASNGAVTLTRTTLGATDTLTFVRGAGQQLVLFNTTAGAINVTLTGTAPVAVVPDGYGGTVSTAGGKSIAVAANGATSIELDDIHAFLSGTGAVTVTGGTGLSAVLFV